MDKRTLKFENLIDLAKFSRVVLTGYIMNTNNYTLTGKFSDDNICLAREKYNGKEIETTEKVFSYES
jgi:hypothetical protein